MSLLARVRSWLAAALARRRVEDDMACEWRFHVDARIDALVAGGMTRGKAERQAVVEFGDPVRWREESRDARGVRLLDEIRADVRYALRQMRRSPGLPLAITLTIALGVGVNVAIFSVVHAVLVRDLPYGDSARLVRLWERSPQGNARNVVSPGNYFDWREQASSFEVIGAHAAGSFGMAMTGSGQPTRVETTRMTASAFAALGVRPIAGRLYDDSEPGATADAGAGDVVISHAFWQQQFGSDRAAVGRVIRLNDRPYTIVGVMPASFDFPTPKTQVWVPVTFTARERAERRSHNWRVVARLKRGVDVATAEAELKTIAARTAALYPQYMDGWSVTVAPLHRDMVGEVEPLLITIELLALVVLLAGCMNLASLLLAKARRREAELALRSAVGAGRRRLVRQIATEVLAFGTIGGVMAVALVYTTLPVLLAAMPADIPLIEHVSIDKTTIGVAAGLAMATSLLVGLVPALRVARCDLRPALQSGHTPGDVQTGRIRATLLVAQFALSIVLMIAAALLVRSFSRLATVDYGFDPNRLVEASIDLPASRYRDQPSQERFYDEMLRRVQALPGVEAATMASDPPMYGNSMTFGFAIEGRPAASPSGREDPVDLVAVLAHYAETLGAAVVEGRAIGDADRHGMAPVVMINQTLARRFWSGGGAVGQHLRFGAEDSRWYEIVGVIADTKDDGLDEPSRPAIFVPYEQREPAWTWLSWGVVVVRLRDGVDPVVSARAVQDAVWTIDGNLPLLSFDRVDTLYREKAARRRFAMQLASAFALLAVGLCAFGIYGVVSYAVGEREQEIGVRMALGASARQILGPFIATGVKPALLGVIVGTLAAAWLTHYLEPVLFETAPTDGTIFAATVVLLLGLATAAAWLPARRAILVDPARSLRSR